MARVDRPSWSTKMRICSRKSVTGKSTISKIRVSIRKGPLSSLIKTIRLIWELSSKRMTLLYSGDLVLSMDLLIVLPSSI